MKKLAILMILTVLVLSGCKKSDSDEPKVLWDLHILNNDTYDNALVAVYVSVDTVGSPGPNVLSTPLFKGLQTTVTISANDAGPVDILFVFENSIGTETSAFVDEHVPMLGVPNNYSVYPGWAYPY